MIFSCIKKRLSIKSNK